MVRFSVLASGSRGNCTVVSGGRTRILLDCGLSCRETFRRMKLANEEPTSLDAILITHEHADHVNGVSVTARKLGIPVYFTEGTHRAWTRWISPRRQMSYSQWLEQCRKQAAERDAETIAADSSDGLDESDSPLDVSGQPADAPAPAEENAVETEQATKIKDPAWLPAVEHFQAGQPFSIGDLAIRPFTISHDAADPVGFVFEAEGVRMGYATDLGYLTPNVKAQLKNLDLLMLESNHDLDMLKDGPYPWAVKQRVLSRVGHLSNDAAAGFLEDEYDGQAGYVILAHLSENNNLPELAKIAAERALARHPSLLANRLLLAEQQQPLSSIYF
jgi:phosphoribosyl 1,2-cyclic phosphodiesterase